MDRAPASFYNNILLLMNINDIYLPVKEDSDCISSISSILQSSCSSLIASVSASFWLDSTGEALVRSNSNEEGINESDRLLN